MNDYQHGDSDYDILRKILKKLGAGTFAFGADTAGRETDYQVGDRRNTVLKKILKKFSARIS